MQQCHRVIIAIIVKDLRHQEGVPLSHFHGELLFVLLHLVSVQMIIISIGDYDKGGNYKYDSIFGSPLVSCPNR